MTSHLVDYKKKYNFDALMSDIKHLSISYKIEKLIATIVMASANCRAYVATHGFPEGYVGNYEKESTHPYWSIQRLGLYSCERLGDLLRQNNMPNETAYWPLFMPVYQERITEHWEKRRRVYFSEPTLDEICRSVNKRNTLLTDCGIFIYSRSDEGDDDYGLPTWDPIYACYMIDNENNVRLHDSTLTISLEIFNLIYRRWAIDLDYGDFSKELAGYSYYA